MASDDFLLDILVCPETHQTLTLANPEQLDRFSQAVEQGQITNRWRQGRRPGGWTSHSGGRSDRVSDT